MGQGGDWAVWRDEADGWWRWTALVNGIAYVSGYAGSREQAERRAQRALAELTSRGRFAD